MNIIFICIAVFTITVILLSWHIVGRWSDGVVMTAVFGVSIVMFAGLTPIYNYHGNTHVEKYEIYETSFGYVAMVDGTVYNNIILHGSDPENVKVVNRKTRCGLGLYDASNYKIVDITESPWKELLKDGSDSIPMTLRKDAPFCAEYAE